MLQGASGMLREHEPVLAICYYHRLYVLKTLKELILSANPNYKIETSYKKIYAKVIKNKFTYLFKY